MGSPFSPIVANLFMEDFEVKATNTAHCPPKMWKRYVDNTCVILDSARKEEFSEHINNMDPHIQFTSENVKPDGSIPFWDILVMPQPDGSLKQQFIESPHIQIFTYIGTTICLLNSVSLIPLDTE